jgi:hypothetical protein
LLIFICASIFHFEEIIFILFLWGTFQAFLFCWLTRILIYFTFIFMIYWFLFAFVILAQSLQVRLLSTSLWKFPLHLFKLLWSFSVLFISSLLFLLRRKL